MSEHVIGEAPFTKLGLFTIGGGPNNEETDTWIGVTVECDVRLCANTPFCSVPFTPEGADIADLFGNWFVKAIDASFILCSDNSPDLLMVSMVTQECSS